MDLQVKINTHNTILNYLEIVQRKSQQYFKIPQFKSLSVTFFIKRNLWFDELQ